MLLASIRHLWNAVKLAFAFFSACITLINSEKGKFIGLVVGAVCMPN